MDQIVAPDVLRTTFRGVAVATKTPDHIEQQFNDWITSREKPPHSTSGVDCEHGTQLETDLSIAVWLREAATNIQNPELRHLNTLAIAIALMRTKVRDQAVVTPDQLDFVWSLVNEAILGLAGSTGPTFAISRSAQGFLAVPLCSLLVEGRIDELWRFHFWLPDGARPALDQGWGIHSHQAFAQSWILAGKGEDVQYSSETVSTKDEASNAIFSLVWTDAAGSGVTYKTHQTQSTVVNTGQYVQVKETERATHARDATYVIPAATYHSTTVDPDGVHATLFVFDANRGFVQDAPVLGPVDQESSTQIREAAGTTALEIAKTTTFMRSVDKLTEEAETYFLGSDLEASLQGYDRALHLCEAATDIPVAAEYRQKVKFTIAGIYRRFGRYETARDIMQALLLEIEPTSVRYMSINGEMSVVYRHMNDFEQAKVMAQIQYDAAKSVGNVKHMCRAAGTLGILNYQLYLRDGDTALLDTAIVQLEERIQLARSLAEAFGSKEETSPGDVPGRNSAVTRWIIGLGRLANCHIVRGDTAIAVELTKEALELSQQLTDTTVIALCNLFHGRALTKDGQLERAMTYLSPTEGCLPAVALCREPSEEYLGYLNELNDLGADFDRVDEHGYSAMDYVEFSGDRLMGEVVVKALCRSLQSEENVDEAIAQRKRESRLRKGYREIFQEELRPVLLKGVNNERTLHDLRHAYATALDKTPERAKMFDHLKYMRYKDFVAFGSVPTSSDTVPGTFAPLLRHFRDGPAGPKDAEEIDFLIFFSYRWINADQKTRSTPDDENNTLYNRMKGALSIFLEKHHHLDQNRLGIWLVRCTFLTLDP